MPYIGSFTQGSSRCSPSIVSHRTVSPASGSSFQMMDVGFVECFTEHFRRSSVDEKVSIGACRYVTAGQVLLLFFVTFVKEGTPSILRGGTEGSATVRTYQREVDDGVEDSLTCSLSWRQIRWV
jgi:hypothetical protein